MLSGLPPLTQVHVYLSLIAIFSGLVVAFGMIAGKRLNGWTVLFHVTTFATVVTGFLHPFHGFLPSQAIGVMTLIALALASYARYSRHFAGRWRPRYVISSVAAVYLTSVIFVVQLFMKVPALHALAPTQTTEPPFLISELVTLVFYVVLTIRALKGFHSEHAHAA